MQNQTKDNEMKFKRITQMILLSTAILGQQSYAQRATYNLPKPIKKVVALKPALMVLLENGGVVPRSERNRTVEVPTGYFTCGTHRIQVTTPDGLVNAALNYIATLTRNFLDPCLNPTQIMTNWRAETQEFEIGDAINHLTDQAIEGATREAILPHATAKYDKVFILEGGAFNPTGAMGILKRYAKSHFFDIHVLAHGGSEVFVGGESSAGEYKHFNDRSFFKPMEKLQKNGLKLVIRSVYQQNCYGYSLSDNWTRIGAKVVSGTPHINYMPLAYGDFLYKWLYMGKNFKDATEEGFDASEDLYRGLYSLLSDMSPSDIDDVIEGSYPLFVGNTAITQATGFNKVLPSLPRRR